MRQPGILCFTAPKMQTATLNTVGVDQPPCTLLIPPAAPPASGALDVPPLSREVVEFILKCFAKSKRTKWVYEQTDLQFPLDGITMRQVKAVADVHGIETERGTAKGESKGGRPKGTPNAKGRLSKRQEVQRLRAEHPNWTYDDIGNAFDPPISRQAVYKHLRAKALT